MTSTKRMPEPMTGEEIVQYQELRAKLIVQAELIMSIFDPINAGDEVTKIVFEIGHPDGPRIEIWHHWSSYGEDCYDSFSCPERYLGMTEDELKAEKTRLAEEEEKKKAKMVARAKALRKKSIAEKEKKDADKRYRKYLELRAEFVGKDQYNAN